MTVREILKILHEDGWQEVEKYFSVRFTDRYCGTLQSQEK